MSNFTYQNQDSTPTLQSMRARVAAWVHMEVNGDDVRERLEAWVAAQRAVQPDEIPEASKVTET